MKLVTKIAQAGHFKVEQQPCPHSSQRVDMSLPRMGILHTTEGGWDAAEGIFHKHHAPHFLVGPNKIVQLVPIGFIGSACRSGPGKVSQNVKAIVQIEMVGFSKETLWRPDRETADALAALMRVCRDEWGIPLVHPWETGDWGHAGYDTPHRHAKKYGHIAGWFAHGDVPDNFHWDPGNFDWSYMFALAEDESPIHVA